MITVAATCWKAEHRAMEQQNNRIYFCIPEVKICFVHCQHGATAPDEIVRHGPLLIDVSGLVKELQTSGKSHGRQQHGCPKAGGEKHLHSSPWKLRNECGITVFECLVTNVQRTFRKMLCNTSCFTRFSYCSA